MLFSVEVKNNTRFRPSRVVSKQSAAAVQSSTGYPNLLVVTCKLSPPFSKRIYGFFFFFFFLEQTPRIHNILTRIDSMMNTCFNPLCKVELFISEIESRLTKHASNPKSFFLNHGTSRERFR